MKRLFSAFLIVVIVLSLLSINVFASDKSADIKDTISTEEKILCRATINDDFEDDSVIVVINNIKSKELKNIQKRIFPRCPL